MAIPMIILVKTEVFITGLMIPSGNKNRSIDPVFVNKFIIDTRTKFLHNCARHAFRLQKTYQCLHVTNKKCP